jgi:hypothetical protein
VGVTVVIDMSHAVLLPWQIQRADFVLASARTSSSFVPSQASTVAHGPACRDCGCGQSARACVKSNLFAVFQAEFGDSATEPEKAFHTLCHTPRSPVGHKFFQGPRNSEMAHMPSKLWVAGSNPAGVAKSMK